jgi:hypothetical protein
MSSLTVPIPPDLSPACRARNTVRGTVPVPAPGLPPGLLDREAGRGVASQMKAGGAVEARLGTGTRLAGVERGARLLRQAGQDIMHTGSWVAEAGVAGHN